jgi:hypothetical protein
MERERLKNFGMMAEPAEGNECVCLWMLYANGKWKWLWLGYRKMKCLYRNPQIMCNFWIFGNFGFNVKCSDKFNADRMRIIAVRCDCEVRCANAAGSHRIAWRMSIASQFAIEISHFLTKFQISFIKFKILQIWPLTFKQNLISVSTDPIPGMVKMEIDNGTNSTKVSYWKEHGVQIQLL